MGFPNTSRNSNFLVSISNIPGLTNHRAFKYFDNYIRSVDLPDFSLDFVESVILDYTINHPISQKNNSLSEITLTFKLSEDLMNYFYAFRYIQSVRYGNNENKDVSEKLVDDVINSVIVTALDNQQRPVAKIEYKNLFISNLSSLSLAYGEDMESEFSISLKYENIIIKIEGDD